MRFPLDMKKPGAHIDSRLLSDGAGDGNRTRVVCLGSRSVAIAPHLQDVYYYTGLWAESQALPGHDAGTGIF